MTDLSDGTVTTHRISCDLDEDCTCSEKLPHDCEAEDVLMWQGKTVAGRMCPVCGKWTTVAP